ncbi:MAG TPA: rod shape-determining protein MreD [Clostridia bacterium]|nr:rod shape-determining protein MreD [Clostridia bacterium]
MTSVSYTSREQIEVYRFSLPVAIGVPLLAIFLQAFLPVRIHFFSIFDLPLLVTIFFAVARRNPVTGLLTGSIIGLVQDALSHHPLGVYGIAKTVVGYVASSLGVKIDVENPGSRFMMTFAFYIVHNAIYFAIMRGLARQNLGWHWGHEFGSALANAVMAVVVFAMLDRFKQRT